MFSAESDLFELWEGAYADLEGDWRVHIVGVDRKRPDVYFVGGFPYDCKGNSLHADAPAILEVWSKDHPGKVIERDRRHKASRAAYAQMLDGLTGRLPIV